VFYLFLEIPTCRKGVCAFVYISFSVHIHVEEDLCFVCKFAFCEGEVPVPTRDHCGSVQTRAQVLWRNFQSYLPASKREFAVFLMMHSMFLCVFKKQKNLGVFFGHGSEAGCAECRVRERGPQ